jgi:DNA-binding NarL/FixJ family response regulator
VPREISTWRYGAKACAHSRLEENHYKVYERNVQDTPYVSLADRMRECLRRVTDTVPTRILLADDSDTVRAIVRLFLEQSPGVAICAEAANGLEAVEKAISLRPDLVVLDVVMPGMNGIEVASILSKQLPQAKIILFTMYGDYVKSLANASGAHIVLAKPEGMTALLKAVNAIANPPGDLQKAAAVGSADVQTSHCQDVPSPRAEEV